MTSFADTHSHFTAFVELQNAAVSAPLLWLKRAASPVQSADMTRHHFRCDAGSRFYQLFVPKSGIEHASGLVVMLHGCKQSASEFAAATRMNTVAERLGLIVVYPEQEYASNALGCWRWYLRSNQKRGRGEPAILAALAEHVRKSMGVPTRMVFAAGLSAGGSMAAVLGSEYPDVFAGVGVHSGLMQGAAKDVRTAFDAMSKGYQPVPGTTKSAPKSRLIVFHGADDQKVVPENATSLFEAFCETRTAKPVLCSSDVVDGSRRATRMALHDGERQLLGEMWMIAGAGHAWSGGSAGGSYSDPRGPNASDAMARFFLDAGAGQSTVQAPGAFIAAAEDTTLAA